MVDYKLICGNALEVLKKGKEKSIQAAICSPPYFGLRSYLFDKAVILRHNLSQEELDYVRKEIEKLGIKPRL